MAFHNVLFPPKVAQGMKSRIVFSTSKVRSTSGFTQSNANWPFHLHEFDVSHVMPNRAKREELQAFYILRLGDVHTFRVLDWAGYFVGMNWVSGVLSHVAPHPFVVADGVTQDFQIGLLYQDAFSQVFKPVTKPSGPDFGDLPVKVYFGNLERTTGWSLDYNTGVLHFAAAPPLGTVIGWSGKYHIECQFKDMVAEFELENPQVADSDVTIIEVMPSDPQDAA